MLLKLPVILPSTSPVDCSFAVHCKYNCKVIGISHYTQITQKIHKHYTNNYQGIVIDYHSCHIVALQVTVYYSPCSPHATGYFPHMHSI